MWISQDVMDQLHKVQLSMFKELLDVMNKLNINYYFVHGSLLGAITRHDFIPEDDDIDIAIFRKDYDRLLLEGNSLLKDGLFIQSYLNDDFPLSFAKLRNCNTAFIQPILNEYDCNKGIYIDIFPIDYCLDNSLKCKAFKYIELLSSYRMTARLSKKRKKKRNYIFSLLSKIIFPSYKRAALVNNYLLSHRKPTEYVTVTNGKITERRLPISWFGKGMKVDFCDINVNCPVRYSDYISQIYTKEYEDYNPANERINKNNQVELSCTILDFEKSYLDYK